MDVNETEAMRTSQLLGNAQWSIECHTASNLPVLLFPLIGA